MAAKRQGETPGRQDELDSSLKLLRNVCRTLQRRQAIADELYAYPLSLHSCWAVLGGVLRAIMVHKWLTLVCVGRNRDVSPTLQTCAIAGLSRQHGADQSPHAGRRW